jgi:hypothetical protein
MLCYRPLELPTKIPNKKGTPILGIRGYIEVFLYESLASRESITPAHAKIMAD